MTENYETALEEAEHTYYMTYLGVSARIGEKSGTPVIVEENEIQWVLPEYEQRIGKSLRAMSVREWHEKFHRPSRAVAYSIRDEMKRASVSNDEEE